MTIPLDEVSFPQKRQRDDVGKVFIWNGRVFRGVLPESEGHVRSLFATGFIQELMAREYIPNTWITDHRLKGFSLILEHEAVWPVIYPQEWTFSMLKDSALLVYRIARLARKYGFDMKDCHGLNVLFDHVTAKYIDLGSFVPAHPGGWSAYEEFLRFYYYPLSIWRYNSFVGKLSIFSGNLTTHETYLMYKHPLTRRFTPRQRRALISCCLVPGKLTNGQRGRIQRRHQLRRRLRPRFLLKQFVRGLIPLGKMHLQPIVREVRSMNASRAPSAWARYHDEVKQKANRFDRIIEIVNGLDGNSTSAVDLGGNQGRFSRLLAERTNLRNVICVDSDENAIDAGYNKEKVTNSGKITFANFDFMGCIAKLRFMVPTERFRSDIAVALALTHHLVFSQGYHIEDVLKNISAYAKKYVLIEFMPLGLSATDPEAKVPGWYTAEWFRRAFVRFFDLILEEKLRANNVLFVGKVR
jgi:hypothetical protein